MKKISFLVLIILAGISAFAQPQMKPNTGLIVGKVTDSEQKPLEYVNIMVHNQSDSSVIDAVSTDVEGKFMFNALKYGTYFLEFKFLGFENKRINNISVDKDNRFVKIGKVTLDMGSQELDKVVVTSQVSSVKYEIDKKVINVSKDIQSAGGSAVDALQNVPSIEVDINGDVSLRGSTNFTVMINGKPSILDANDALQQIQASNIDRIEIITNPSAKYDPDGDAGIINIITKNKKDDGFSGKIEIGGDNNMGYKADILINYKKNKLNTFVEFDTHNRTRPMGINQHREIISDSSIFYMDAKGQNTWGHGNVNGKFGLRYDFNDFNNISINLEGGKRFFKMKSLSEQHLWWSDNPMEYYFMNTSDFSVAGTTFSGDVNFEHKFNDKGHLVKAYFQLGNWEHLRQNLATTDTTNSNWETISEDSFQERTIQNMHRTMARFQIDYELPINNKTKLEAGYLFRYRDAGGDYNIEDFNTSNGTWETNPAMYNNLIMFRQIHAGYVTFSSSLGKIFDYKLGLRTEYTDRKIVEEVTSTNYTINRPDFFPTVHLSKALPFDQQIQMSYSKRINRPQGWNLNPFGIQIDRYTIRKGNPALEPEYTNSFELNYIKNFGKSYISVESYYKQTDGKIDRIQEVSGDQIIFTAANMNKDFSLGGEIMTNLVIMKMLMLNLSSNIYQYGIDGSLDGVPVNEQTFTWNSRGTIMTMLPTGTSIQFGAFYKAPSLSLQGKTNAMFMTFGGVRQSFFKRKMNVSLSVQDIFNTMNYSFTTETASLISTSEYYSLHPTISLTLTYNFRNYKSERKDGNSGSMDSDFSGEGQY